MKATIDRIDEGMAVLVDREDDTLRLRVPVVLLPQGSREGDVIMVSFGRDEAATAAAKKKVSGLIEKLRSGP